MLNPAPRPKAKVSQTKSSQQELWAFPSQGSGATSRRNRVSGHLHNRRGHQNAQSNSKAAPIPRKTASYRCSGQSVLDEWQVARYPEEKGLGHRDYPSQGLGYPAHGLADSTVP